MSEHTWHGDWLIRIYQRVRTRGFPSVTAFAEVNSSATLVELADALGEDDVAAVQIESALREEAREAGALDRFARDLLVRCIRANFPMGWSSGESFDFERSGVYVDWCSGVEGFIDELTCDAVWKSLQCAIPRDGWLPAGPNDPILDRAFASVHIDGAAADSQIGIIAGMGRPWPGDWNIVVMGELGTLEHRLARRLHRDEVLEVVRELMKKYDIKEPFQRDEGP